LGNQADKNPTSFQAKYELIERYYRWAFNGLFVLKKKEGSLTKSTRTRGL
jgi:hypothetical protein